MGLSQAFPVALSLTTQALKVGTRLCAQALNNLSGLPFFIAFPQRRWE
jgi:hypothetical protein